MKLLWKGFALVVVLSLAGCPGPTGETKDEKKKDLDPDDTPVTVGDGSVKIIFEKLAQNEDPRNGLRGRYHIQHPRKNSQIAVVQSDDGSKTKDCKQKDCIVIVNFSDLTEVSLEPRAGRKGLIVFNSRGFNKDYFTYVTNIGWVYEDKSITDTEVTGSVVDDNSGTLYPICEAKHCDTKTHHKP